MRTSTNRFLALIAGSLILNFSLGWADQKGTSTAQFLRIGQGARSEGMGGAFTAVADDAHATYFNPAGLAQITRYKLAIDHLEFIEDISSQFASMVVPVNKANGSLGASVTYIDMGSIDKRVDATTANGTADVTSYAAALSYGQALGDALAIGVTGKTVNQDLAGEKEDSLAADAGILLFAIPDRLALGASILNLGSKVKIGTTEEDLPTTIRGGLGYYAIPKVLTLAADVEKERDTDAIIHLGGEYIYNKMFALRAGWRDTNEAGGGFSAGAGYLWYVNRTGQGSKDFFGRQISVGEADDSTYLILIDYAYVDYGDFDATHRIGLQLVF